MKSPIQTRICILHKYSLETNFLIETRIKKLGQFALYIYSSVEIKFYDFQRWIFLFFWVKMEKKIRSYALEIDF